jgi:hypothetical protein
MTWIGSKQTRVPDATDAASDHIRDTTEVGYARGGRRFDYGLSAFFVAAGRSLGGNSVLAFV